MQVFFERREELILGIWEYTFRPERPVDFAPGQYVDVRIGHESRTFTLTSLPSDPVITFITKHFALQSTYKHALQSLESGAATTIGDAMGDLVLPKNPAVPLVFIAGGIGMASYASMFKDLLSRKEERPVFLFYRLRAAREQLYRELTEAYPLQLKQIILAPNGISAEDIKATTPEQALVYLSGSQGFVEALRADLEALGTPRSSIVFDYYDGYTEL